MPKGSKDECRGNIKDSNICCDFFTDKFEYLSGWSVAAI
jgi:hypothetical protein